MSDDRVPFELSAAINAAADAVAHAEGVDSLARWLVELREAKAGIAAIDYALEHRLGEEMGEKRVACEAIGKTLERHRDRSWRNWQSDDLLRIVLDSDRRPKNTETGEVETDLDVLRHVYGLKGYHASRTALKERGVDPEEYAEYEDRGWKVQIR